MEHGKQLSQLYIHTGQCAWSIFQSSSSSWSPPCLKRAMRSSRPSFMFFILSPESAACASALFLSWSYNFGRFNARTARIIAQDHTCKIRSSTVSGIDNLRMFTVRFWPNRCARSKAWSSKAGFHHRSTRMTLLQHVKLRPVNVRRSNHCTVVGECDTYQYYQPWKRWE